jgi:phenylpropionate dioxygenase-like ring-hydroxylating dioxygenase large terminal subunit
MDTAVWIRAFASTEVGRRARVWQLTHQNRTRPVLLWRIRSGQVAAIDAVCPHRGYLMRDAFVIDDTVECPLHGYRFGVDGRCVNYRHSRAAHVIEVREADGYLWLAPPPE